jgi:LuxR family maltose regulon positive regulatory protein
MHVIMISRILPDLPLTEMIARREILAIGQEELKFRRDEIYTLASQMRDDTPTPEQVENLAVRLEGWPAGTVLAIHPLPEDLERAMLRGGAGPEALFHNLANSMLQAQPPSIRDFLLASSTLTRLTPQLCRQALGLHDSELMLGDALNKNMFLTRVTGGLAYHTLFRELLQDHLLATDAKLFYGLHLQAAEWFAENDQIVEAVDHYIMAGELLSAVELADRVAYSYFAQGNNETLLNWAASLESIKHAGPNLLLYCARLHINRYEYELAIQRLDDADFGFSQRRDDKGCLEVRSMRAWTSFFQNRYDEAFRLAQRILDDANQNSPVYGDSLSLLGVINMQVGDIESAVEYRDAAQPILRADGDAYSV